MPVTTKIEERNMQFLAQSLRRARTKYAVGLRELARDEDLSASQLWRVENAQEKASERVLEVYAKRFRMELDELRRLRWPCGQAAVQPQKKVSSK